MRADDEFDRGPRPRRRLFGKRPAGRLSRQDRKAMEEFVRTRIGVEAYVEPQTLQHSMSVVLVATDGEWVRFSIPDESVLRELGRRRPVPVYDVGLVGYPKRMKEYRRPTE
jgi:hypothetical protein